MAGSTKTGVTTVTKKDVTRRAAKIAGDKIYVTERYVNAFFDALCNLLAEAKSEIRIEIRDFGVFEIKKTRPKPKARNPRTGEIVYVPARRKAHFKPGKKLKEALKIPLDELEGMKDSN